MSDRMPIRFAYALTAEEFVEGHMTALKASTLGRLSTSWLALSFVFFLVSALMAVVAWAVGLERQTLGGVALAIIPLSLWVGYITARGHAKRWRKMFEETPAYREEVRWSVSEGGADLASATSRSSVEWSYFTKVIEGEHVIVLIGSGAGYFIPRRAFESEADLERFLATVRSQAKPAA